MIAIFSYMTKLKKKNITAHNFVLFPSACNLKP